MSVIRDLLRPVFRLITKPHIDQLCAQTRDEFESYENKYMGKRCFIVANGPSLRIEDLDCLAKNDEITFGMNRIYMLYDRTIWRPTFYIAQDPTVIRACCSEITEFVKASKVFIKSTGESKYDIPNAVNFKLDYSYVAKGIRPGFYTGNECEFADGKSVTYTALQLAVYMGFKTIYLLGADCNYSKDNKSISRESYPDSRMYDEKKVGMSPDMEYLLEAYKSASEYALDNNIKIFNATRGGMLEIFERVIFDELF